MNGCYWNTRKLTYTIICTRLLGLILVSLWMRRTTPSSPPTPLPVRRLILTSIVRRKASSSSAVQMLLKFGCWPSTVIRILSNQASFRSELGQTSALRAFLSIVTQRRDSRSAGEPVISDACKRQQFSKKIANKWQLSWVSERLLSEQILIGTSAQSGYTRWFTGQKTY